MFLFSGVLALLAGLTPARAAQIWVVHTELVGEMNTLTSVATTLASQDQIRIVQYTELSKITPISPDSWPDMIFHSLGRPKEIEAILDFKNRSAGKTKVINFFDPISRHEECDLIVSSRHMDKVPFGEVLEVSGVPSQINAEKLAIAFENGKTLFADLPRPIIAVTIGGPTKGATFTAEHGRKLGELLSGLHQTYNGTLLITNSRRTPPSALDAILAQVDPHAYLFFDWSEWPEVYPEMLAHSDHIVVTGDSMSMLSDATATGKPVYVYAPRGSMEPRHMRYVLELSKQNRVRPLSFELSSWVYEPLNATQSFANGIRERFPEIFLSGKPTDKPSGQN